jgi:glucose-6-phosphate isomerase
MERATLILKVRDTLVVIGIGGCEAGPNMVVGRNGGRLVDIEYVFVHRGNDGGYLGEHEEPQQASSQIVNRADERHAAST